jgi:hypothetical protein
MVPGAGLEPARNCFRGILSPLRLPIPPPGQGWTTTFCTGGWGRNRTGVRGFAGRYITTLPPSQKRAGDCTCFAALDTTCFRAYYQHSVGILPVALFWPN